MPFARTPLCRRIGQSLVVLCAAAVILASALFVGRRGAAPEGGPPPAALAEAREAYGRIPLSFEANRGQTDGAVDFLARGAGYALFLKPDEAVFVLSRRPAPEEAPAAAEQSQAGARPEQDGGAAETRAVLRMRLVGSDSRAAAQGAGELEGKANYLLGDDPSKWRAGVPTFASVRYAEVYPGVDLVYYGNQRQLEYDFVVAPGRDPAAVRLRFEGADRMELGAEGELLLTLGEEVVRQPRPFVYQEVAGARRAVEGGYKIEEGGHVAFALGEYDPALPLVIDPVLIYSTYLGGTGDEGSFGSGNDIAVDSAGNAYVCGSTLSTNFPTANAFQAANAGTEDVFVAKLNAAGSNLVYSTYLGGGSQDRCFGLAVDSSGRAHVTGQTFSANFPTANAIDATLGTTNEDAFVTRLAADGSALVYSTYLGGDESSEFGRAIAVDSAGNTYVTGITFSDDFPTFNALQATFGGGSVDAYLAKINSDGTAFVYSTYLGGSGNDDGNGVAADSAGNAYVAGRTSSSTNFPLANAIQATYGGGEADAFVSKVNSDGTAFVYSTYLGGSGLEVGEDIKADSTGNAYPVGQTSSTNFPTANAFQPANGGTTVTQDAFVAKLNPTGSAFIFSTYLGGSGGEIGRDIALDPARNVYVTGVTTSLNSFPTVRAIQCTRAGDRDVFVTKFNAVGSTVNYSTYLGGAARDDSFGIAADTAGNAYVTGQTTSTNFPTANAFQAANAGSNDAFIFKLSGATGPTCDQTTTSTFRFERAGYAVQEEITAVTVAVTRTGDLTAAATVDFATADATASERQDYTTALGTLRFPAGVSRVTFQLLVNEDSKVEGAERFTVALSNPTGGATLAAPSMAEVVILDDAVERFDNVIDINAAFVGQHYHDFLGRQHDPAGLAFWTAQLDQCGTDAACLDAQRENVSAAFFLSIEFQETGYRIIRIYESTFPDSPQRPRGLPRYREFIRDMREIHRGVVVGVGNWEEQLRQNTLEFARDWVQRPEVLAQLPETLTAEQFVDRLFERAEVTPTADERAAAVAAFGAGGVEGRADALLSVINSASVNTQLFNRAFVLMQYFGYLRRSPDDPPDTDFGGYDFWLNKLNSFNGDFRAAEMVKAFLVSIEYRNRFGR